MSGKRRGGREIMRWQAHFLAKQSHQPDEYEDAFAADPVAGRFALADGASESSFAGQWARLLVEAFVREPLRSSLHWAEWLGPLRRHWIEQATTGPLPWYAEAKAELGAFATLLGLMIGERHWRAVAVGDSCLFHLRHERLLRCFPLTTAEEFGTQPDLVGSRVPTVAELRQKQLWGRGSWRQGDQLFLMTDALAQGFLLQKEAGAQPWTEINSVLAQPCPAEAFADWVADLRTTGIVRNDDVTLLVIQANGKEGRAGGVNPLRE